MDAARERKSAAFVVLAGTLFASGTHLIGAIIHCLGMFFASSPDGAIATSAIGALLSWTCSALVIAFTLRRAAEPGLQPSAAIGVLAIATSLFGTLGASALAALAASAIPSQLARWPSRDSDSVGDVVMRISYATAGLQLAGMVVNLVVVAFALAWLAGRATSARDPG